METAIRPETLRDRRIIPAVLLLLSLATQPRHLVAQIPADPPAPQSEFVIIALPDTQNYSKSAPQTFTAQTHWIMAQRDALKIAFVTHLGDIVQDGDEPPQWVRASESMSVLEVGLGIPYGLCVGNHDAEPRGDRDGTANFNLFFPHTRYASRPWYGGHHGADNDNSYQLFSAGGMDFIALHLEYDAADEVLAWADGVLKAHAHRRAIVSSHDLLSKTEPNQFSDQGQDVYDALKGNPNLFMLLCGHCSDLQEGRRVDVHQGHTVHTILSDYQDRDHGGDGWMRIMRFRPGYNDIQVFTYSPVLGEYENDDSSKFTLPYDMGGIETVRSDLDRDGDVDAEDFGVLQACFADPYQQLADECLESDLDRDGHVNQNDFAIFVNCLSGPRIPVNPGCDPPG